MNLEAVEKNFFCYKYVIILLVKRRLFSIVLCGIEVFFPSAIKCEGIFFNLVEKMFVKIL